MRGKQAQIRQIDPDFKYNSTLVAKLITSIMKEGKKITATKIVYKTLDELGKHAKKKDETGYDVFTKAVENVSPKVEIRPRRIGGANYQVPVPVNEVRATTLALRWIVEVARDRRKNTEFFHSLTQELLDAVKEEGSAYKRKINVHKMAEANAAFSQYNFK